MNLLRRIGSAVDGPQTMWNGPASWATFAVLIALAAVAPLFTGPYVASNLAYFLSWTFMALGLSLLWGYTGVLSFGQTAFFGLAGYSYGVVSINLGDAYGLTWLAVLVALLMAAALAAVLGYFMFYGGIRDVFVGIVTLSVTLVFETFMAQTAGPEWAIGRARLNGFNGMSGMPPLTIPMRGGDIILDGNTFLWFELALLAAVQKSRQARTGLEAHATTTG